MPPNEDRTFQDIIDATRRTKESIDEFHVSFLDLGEKILKTLSSSFAAQAAPSSPAPSASPKLSSDTINITDIFKGPAADAAAMLNINKYTALQTKLLTKLDTAVQSTQFAFDDKLKLTDVFAKPSGTGGDIASILTSSRFAELQKDLISTVQTAVASMPDIKFDTELKIADILGTNETADKLLFFEYRKLKKTLLKNLQTSIGESSTRVDESSADSSESGLTKVVEEGFGETHRYLKQLVTFLEPDNLGDLKAQRTKTDKYSRLFGGDKDAPSTPGGDDKSAGVLGKLGKGFGTLIESILSGLGRGLQALSNPKLFIGVGVLTALTGVLALSAIAFKQFGDDVNWKNVFIGIGAIGALAGITALLSKVAPLMLLGSVAILALAGAIGLAGLSFQQFADISWRDVFIGIGAIAALSVLAVTLGIFAPLAFTGALAIAALGAALIPFAGAMRLLAPTMTYFAEAFERAGSVVVDIAEAIGKGFSRVIDSIMGGMSDIIDSVGSVIEKLTSGLARINDSVAGIIDSVRDMLVDFIDSIIRLGEVDGADLRDTAVGIGAISAAIAAFGAGAGLGKLMSFFADDPVERFERFAALSEGLNDTATAIAMLGESINAFESSNIDQLSAGLKVLGDSLSGFATTGIFRRRDPLAPLREIAELIPKFSFGDIDFSSTLSTLFDIIENPDGLNIFAQGLDLVASAFDKLAHAVDHLDMAKFETALEMMPSGATGVNTRIRADDLEAAYHEQASLKDQAENDRMHTFASTVVDNSKSGISNQHVNNVTYNQTNHIDDTLSSLVLSNRY